MQLLCVNIKGFHVVSRFFQQCRKPHPPPPAPRIHPTPKPLPLPQPPSTFPPPNPTPILLDSHLHMGYETYGNTLIYAALWGRQRQSRRCRALYDGIPFPL